MKTKLRWSPPTVLLYIRNLNKTSVRKKSRGVYLLIGWVFPSYSMTFRLCWTWGRLCVVVDSLISAAKVCDCSILLRRFVFRKVEASDWWWAARDHGKGTDGRRSPLSPSRLPLRARERRLGTRQVWLCDFRMVLTGMSWRGWTAVSPKYSVPAVNIVSSVFSLADCTLEKQLSTQENWI